MGADFKIEGIAPMLHVFAMPASLRFYRDIWGFSVVMSSDPNDETNWVLLKLNSAELMPNTAYELEHRALHPDYTRIAAHQDACLYFGCPDTDALYAHLIKNGIELNKPEITRYNWKAINLKDPDGHGLCFH